MKLKPEFCINFWLKDLLSSRKYFPLCKFCDFVKVSSNFQFIFNFSHSLLDQKINNILSVSNDQVVLAAVQSIIQNMLASEDASQQPLHFLQSCGFGGLWRFAQGFQVNRVSFFFNLFLRLYSYSTTCSKNPLNSS